MPTQLSLKHHWLMRYGAALGAVGVALLVRLGLTALVGEGLPTYITFYPAIMAVALLGGFGPGLAATLAAALVVDYWLLPPVGGLGVARLVDAVGVAFFIGMGIFMSVFAELYRRARQKGAGHDTELLRRAGLEPRRARGESVLLVGGMVLSLAILMGIGWQHYRSLAATAEAERWETHSYQVIQGFDRLLSAMQDVETGQRGYLLSGKEEYLEPYQAALSLEQTNLASLKQLTQDNPHQQRRLAIIEALVREKLAVARQAIDLRRGQGLELALALLETRGKAAMDQLRRQIAEAEQEESRLLEQRAGLKVIGANRILQALLGGGVLSLLLLLTVFMFLAQENRRRRRAEAGLLAHQAGLRKAVADRTAELAGANDSLRQQREWLRVTLQSIGDAVLAADNTGHVTFLNPVAQSLTGWSEQEALGEPVQSVLRIIDEQTRAPAEDIFARVVREGRVVALANHSALVARDGREIPIEDSAAPIQGVGGAVSGVVLVFHDVTQKRRAQEELRKSEERLRFALETNQTGAWELDLRDHTAHRSLEHDRIFGYSELLPQWSYEMFLEHVLPEDRPGVDAKFRQAMESGGDWSFECRIRRADLQVRWIWAAGRHRTDAKGVSTAIAGIVQDITERKRAEAALAQSELQFRTLADSIPNLAWWANPDGYITWYNRRWYDYTGTTPEEMEGWGWQKVHDPQALPAVLERWKASIAGGEPFEMTFPLRGADGSFRPFLTRGVPLKDAEGQVQQWFGTNTDVSDQKRAEESAARLAAIVGSADDAIISKDTDGRITSWNAGAERLFGYRAEEVMGRPILVLLPPERQDEEAQLWARLQAGERIEHFETIRLTKDGRRVPVSATISPLADAEGRIIGAAKILRDITQRRQAEVTAQQLNAELAQRLAQVQAANEEVQTSRRAALSLAEDALEARQEAERINAELKQAVASLKVSHHAALNLMDDAVLARKEAEQASAELEKLNRTLRAHSQSDQALLRAQSEPEYLQAVCRIVVEDCGHAMVWVGLAEDDPGKTVRPAASAGFEDGYLATLQVTWADTERGRGPTGVAIRTGQPTLCRDMQSDPRFAPWRDEALKRGFNSSLVLPLLNEGRAFGALTIYSRVRDGFSAEEVKLLTDLAGDVAFGVSSLRLREAKARAEEALRHSEERYRGLVELSPEAVFVNRNNRLVLVNPAALALFGASSADQLLGKSPFELFHPDFHPLMRQRIAQVLDGHIVPALETRITRLDGAVVEAESMAAPVIDQGERAILVLVRDITERKRAEQRTELLAETAARLLAAEAPQTIVEDLCRKVLAFLDCQVFLNYLVEESPEAGGGVPTAPGEGSESRPQVGARLRLNAAGGLPPEALAGLEWLDFGTMVCGCVARDGSCIVVQDVQHTPDARTALVKSLGIQAYACHPLLAQGQVLGTLSFGARNRPRFTEEELALMSAITDQVAIALERRRAQAALQRTAEDLQRSNRDLEQFAYVASHDLQEPLRAVGGYVRLLQLRFPDKLDARAHRYLEGAFDGATRMEQLITDLLAYSRVGTRGADFAAADLNAVVERALTNLESGIASAHGTVTHDALPTVLVDATQMMQLLQNLIGNALKFQGSQPPRIHVGARHEAGRWVLSVRDNGIGIEPQYYAQIFQVFQRLHTRKDYPGTGIGLAICKRIVERHGGSIWVESQPGQGSTFFFSLPEAPPAR